MALVVTKPVRQHKDAKHDYQVHARDIEKSPVLVTLLNPYIGYLKAAEIYKEALKTGKGIRELVLSKKLMTAQ